MKPICVGCQCFYFPKKNGFRFIEGMPNGSTPPEENIRGKRKPEAWEPYKLWIGDLWECPDCHHQVVVGCGHQPYSEHYKPEFAERVAASNVTLTVNDC